MKDRPLRIKLGAVGRKSMRLDRPADDTEAAPEPEVSRLRELFRKAIGASAGQDRERRHVPRHPAVEHDLWVGWWVKDNFEAFAGHLIDISRGGAKVILSARPPRKQSVWVYKEVGDDLSTARGELVGVTPSPGGRFAARIRFASPCPTLLCQAMACAQSKRPAGLARGDFDPAAL